MRRGARPNLKRRAGGCQRGRAPQPSFLSIRIQFRRAARPPVPSCEPPLAERLDRLARLADLDDRRRDRLRPGARHPRPPRAAGALAPHRPGGVDLAADRPPGPFALRLLRRPRFLPQSPRPPARPGAAAGDSGRGVRPHPQRPADRRRRFRGRRAARRLRGRAAAAAGRQPAAGGAAERPRGGRAPGEPGGRGQRTADLGDRRELADLPAPRARPPPGLGPDRQRNAGALLGDSPPWVGGGCRRRGSPVRS